MRGSNGGGARALAVGTNQAKKKPKRNSRTCHLAVAIDGDHSAHLRGATLLRRAMSVLSVMQMGREDPWQFKVAMTWL